jgi:hypothetical protein
MGVSRRVADSLLVPGRMRIATVAAALLALGPAAAARAATANVPGSLLGEQVQTAMQMASGTGSTAAKAGADSAGSHKTAPAETRRTPVASGTHASSVAKTPTGNAAAGSSAASKAKPSPSNGVARTTVSAVKAAPSGATAAKTTAATTTPASSKVAAKTAAAPVAKAAPAKSAPWSPASVAAAARSLGRKPMPSMRTSPPGHVATASAPAHAVASAPAAPTAKPASSVAASPPRSVAAGSKTLPAGTSAPAVAAKPENGQPAAKPTASAPARPAPGLVVAKPMVLPPAKPASAAGTKLAELGAGSGAAVKTAAAPAKTPGVAPAREPSKPVTPVAVRAAGSEKAAAGSAAPIKRSASPVVKAPTVALTGKSPMVVASMPLEDHVSYQYNALGRRDPFMSLLEGEFVGDDVGGNAPPDVGGLKVVGIVWGTNDQFAMVEDVSGNSFVLRRGDKVMNGFVEGLKRDGMIVNITVDGQSESVVIPITRKGDRADANR